MSAIYLAISFVLSGLNATCSKVLIQMHLGAYSDTYLLSAYATSLVVGLVSTRGFRLNAGRQDFSVGILMGLFVSLGYALFMVVLSHTTGIVAFPIRSLGNLVLTAILSIIAWHEKLSKSQWVGLVLSLTAIWLLA
jgi:multidrug transporter EmrE-like cation transporter